MRFLCIHETEGEVNIMDEKLRLALLEALQQQTSQFHNTDEFMQYMKDADVALETVKNILLEDGSPEKVLQRCFHMLIAFYDADWCAVLQRIHRFSGSPEPEAVYAADSSACDDFLHCCGGNT